MGGVSVEIRRSMVESMCGSCGLPFNRGDVCVGHTGAGEAFAEFAGSKKDGSGRGQNLARRPACEVASASFHSAGPIAGTRVSCYQKPALTLPFLSEFAQKSAFAPKIYAAVDRFSRE